MILAYNNLIDAPAVVITDTSEVSTLPGSNVANEAISKVWRTGTSVALESITFDLGSAMAATTAIIAGHTLIAGDSLIQVRGSTDNFASSNVLVASFTWLAGNMIVTFGSVSYRYWKITFTKASSGVSRDIGRIFIGTNFTSIADVDFAGHEIINMDNSVDQVSRGGQTYTDKRKQFKQIKLTLSAWQDTDSEGMRTFADTVGMQTRHFLQVATSGVLSDVWYVKLSAVMDQSVSGFDGTSYLRDISPAQWDQQL